MLITRLRLTNFRQHADTTLELGPGLTGIIGPNGAGKTTLLEAIAWAMYGTPAARGTREGIRRRGAPPKARVEVELEFDLGAHHYRVVRTLGGAELYQDRDPAPIANSLGAVTDRVTRLLGMSREEFFNTYFTGQKELAVMSAMSAPERAQFLSRVLGYERLKVAQDRLRERRSSLRANIEGLERSLPAPEALQREREEADARIARAEKALADAQATLDAAVAALAQVRPEWERVQAERERVVKLDGERRVLEHQVRTARERFTALDRELAEALAARDRLRDVEARLAPLPGLLAERDALQSAAVARQAHQDKKVQEKETAKALAQLDARLAQLPGPEQLARTTERLQRARARHAEATAAAAALRTQWVRDAQDARTKRQALLDRYNELKEQLERLERLGAAGTCPTCGRPLGDGAQSVLEMLARQLEDVLVDGKFYRQRVEQLATEPPALRRAEQQVSRLDRVVSALAEQAATLAANAEERTRLERARAEAVERLARLRRDLAAEPAAFDEERFGAVQRQVAELEPLRLEAARLKGKADRAETLVQESEAAERELTQREQALAAIDGQLAALGFSEARFEAARQALERAEARHREADHEWVRAEAERRAAHEARAAAERRRQESEALRAELEQKRRQLAIATELDRAFSELRGELNMALRPDLSDLASGFLRDLTRGRYTDLELTEDYVPVIMDEGEARQVISGGEEDMLNLALRLAISQMIAERAGQPLSLLVLDEIFGSLDDDRRTAVVDLLRALADRFPQVILITHIESVRDGFDRIIRVELDTSRGIATARDEQLAGVTDVAA